MYSVNNGSRKMGAEEDDPNANIGASQRNWWQGINECLLFVSMFADLVSIPAYLTDSSYY